MLRTPVSTQSAAVLSSSQRRQWFLHQHAAETAHWRTVLIEYAGRADAALLTRQLQALTEAHEELRASYHLEGRNPVRRVHAVQRAAPVLEAIHIDESEFEARLAQLDHSAPDLAAAPSFTPYLFVLEQRSVLALRVHSISFDRWSDQVFASALAALQEGVHGPAEQAGEQMARAACAAQADCADVTLDEGLAYWRARLDGMRVNAELPTDSARTFAPSGGCTSLAGGLATGEAAELAAFAAQRCVRPFAVHLAAMAIVLHRWTGEPGQLIGNALPGRVAHQALTIGCFDNVIPVRVVVPDAPLRCTDFIAAVDRNYAQDRRHGGTPLERIVQQREPARRGARSPLFDVATHLQRDLAPLARGLDGVAIGPFTLREAGAAAHVDLNFVVKDHGEQWQVVCEYDPALFREGTVATLLDAYRVVLLQLVRFDLDVRDVQVPAALDKHAAQAAASLVPVCIAGDLTLDSMLDALHFWSGVTNLRTSLQAPLYGQLYQELVAPAGALARNTRGFNIIVVRYEQWCASAAGAEGLDMARSLAAAGQFAQAIAQLAARNPAPHIMLLGQPDPAWERRAGFDAVRRGADRLIEEALHSAPNLHCIRPQDIAARYPIDTVHEAHGAELGDMPYSEDYYRALATVAFRRALALFQKPAKVIVLDCDYTLWHGACSEVAVGELVISDEAMQFQLAMQEKRREGVLLCLCSQNDEADVWRVFDQHPRMVLRREDITLARIDWNSKPAKIASLGKELNLSLDSFVFLDDDPVQCAQVRAQLPQVATVQVSIPQLPAMLGHLWVLDARAVAASSGERTRYYQDEGRRSGQRASAASYAHYLEQLNLAFTFHALHDATHIDRVCELSYRTNQFNLTARQLGNAEISAAMAQRTMQGLVLHLQDDFGDYGVVGAVLFSVTSAALEVTDMFLSCRALQRGAEHQMLQRVAQEAHAAGLPQLHLHWRATGKNAPALAFIESLAGGAAFPGHGYFSLPTQQALALRFDPTVATANAARDLAAVPHEKAQPARHGAAAASNHIAHKLRSIGQLSEALKSARLGWSHRESTLVFEVPRTDEEVRLAAIWSDVLGIPVAALGVDDRFIDLGGQSLLGMRMLSRVRKEMTAEVSIREFVEGPTIRALAQVVKKKSLTNRTRTRMDQLEQSGQELERGEL